MKSLRSTLLALLLSATVASAQRPEWALPNQTDADRGLRALLNQKVDAIEAQSLDQTITSRADWEGARDRLRIELKEMLGLHPEPPRTDLQPVVTGTFEGDGYVVENLHFQPMPRLYLAANLFRPKVINGKLPAILYVCGHSNVQENGVSLGNKTHYHHHGVWFARHGYVCLVLDTVQWGELVGHHHGTYRLGRWWWASRGYTPAGVETWNGIRALDYLQSRPEVDPDRLGMTGRSGGGVYTWWVAAVDERIKVSAPTAGIATLRNHVIDGCIEGHCDCMYMHNIFHWDFDRVAALVAPRPLLIANTDKDEIFPLDGVYSIYRSTRRIYGLLGAEDRIGLQIAEGPHEDMQALNVGAFAWFERFLKGAGRMDTFDEAAKPSIPLARLRVFTESPKDERTTRIDEDFVPAAAPPPVPATATEWAVLRDAWIASLRDRVFRPGPGDTGPAELITVGLDSERRDAGSGEITLVLKPAAAPFWTGDERKQTQFRRRLLLLGSSLEREQVAAIRQLVRDLRASEPARPIRLEARGDLAALALYVAVLEPGVTGLELFDIPESHATGPCLPTVLRYLDLPQALALAGEHCAVTVHGARQGAWTFATETARILGWKSLKLTAAVESTVQRWFTPNGHPSDETFFPIAVWLQDPRNAARYQAAGINLFVGLWNGPTEAQLDSLSKAGMPVICDQNAIGLSRRNDPIIAAWMHGDEPDNAQSLPGGNGYGPPILPEVIVKDYIRLREADPTRPVLLNLGQGVAFDNYIGRGVRRNHPEDYANYTKGCDIASFDIYPVVHESPEVSGKLELVARGVERLGQWTEGKKPIWNCIECTDIGGIGRQATASQVRSEIWMALIRGSRGLIYFVHQFKPDFNEAALLSDPAMLAAVTDINRQIKELAPFLNRPASAGVLGVRSPTGSPVMAVLKEFRGTTCIFAANKTPQPASAEFILSGGAVTKAHVLHESREVVVTDRTFKDSFEPYSVHLYRLE